jgi:hypothetical protein
VNGIDIFRFDSFECIDRIDDFTINAVRKDKLALVRVLFEANPAVLRRIGRRGRLCRGRWKWRGQQWTVT